MTRPDAAPTRPKRLLFALASLALGLIAAMAIVELVARAIGLEPEGIPMRRVEILDDGEFRPASTWGTAPVKQVSPFFPEVKTGEYIPGLTFRFVYADNPRGYFDEHNAVVNHINRHGLRGEELTVEKPEGVVRILGIGDSFTFGAGVRNEDTFLSRLEAELNHGLADDRFEVVNAGVASYNTADEVTYLENRWMDLAPDVVLLVFVINDAYDDAVFGPLHRGYVEGMTRLVQSRQVYGSRFLAWALDRYWRAQMGRKTREIYLSQFTLDPMIEGHNWEDSRRGFERARDVTRERGARLGIVIFPELHSLGDTYPFESLHDIARREAEALGIPVLDLLETFRGERAAQLWVHPTDHHPNERGHDIAATAIHEFLWNPEFGLLPGAAPGR
jgi:lysophospholipase L1-like esterase